MKTLVQVFTASHFAKDDYPFINRFIFEYRIEVTLNPEYNTVFEKVMKND